MEHHHNSEFNSGLSQIHDDERALLNGLVFNVTTDPVLLLDLSDNSVIAANPTACNQFSQPADRFAGKSFPDQLIDPHAFRKAMRRKVTVLDSVSCIKRDGTLFNANMSVFYQKSGNNSFALVVLSGIVDENEAERTFKRLETLVLERFKTESAFFLGEEQERNRLARELHGHIGPMMVSVKLGLEQMLSGGKKHISRKELKRLLEQHVQTIRELRLVTSRLAEGFLYQDNVIQAICSLVTKFEEFSGIKIYCKLAELHDSLSIAQRYHLIQVLEESLTNVVQHANATKIAFRLWVEEGRLNMYILDNGRGMEKFPQKKGNGLWIMKQRAALMQGSLQIESVYGRYCRLYLTFPVNS